MELIDLVEEVRMNLGYPTVEVHTDQKTIEAQAARALRYYNRYCPKIASKTVKPAKSIDLSAEAPRGILKCYAIRTLDNNLDLPLDAFVPYVQSAFRYSGGLVGFMAQIQSIESVTEFIKITEWELVEGHRVLLSYPGGVQAITLYYFTNWTDVNELTDTDLQWVLDYTTAHVKQIEGRVLRKYRVQDLDLDGDNLISEGRDEQTRLEEQVQQQMPMLLGGKI